MANLEQIRAQRKYFEEHMKEILTTKARFAMVHSNKVEYFQDKGLLFKSYPHLAPGASPVFGNFPMFIDIGKKTNSLEYKTEKLEEREENFHNSLIKTAEEFEKIKRERKKLDNL